MVQNVGFTFQFLLLAVNEFGAIQTFKLDKEAAKQALRNYYKGKRLLPKAFSNENHIEEIKGVYVPFWLFDGQGDADIRFNATKVQSYRQGDYQVTITDHYDVRRAGTVNFSRIPVDGSRKMPDAHMDAIVRFLDGFENLYCIGRNGQHRYNRYQKQKIILLQMVNLNL